MMITEGMAIARAETFTAQILAQTKAPDSEDLELIGDCVDALHECGLHEQAHKMDEAMCRWCELLLDA